MRQGTPGGWVPVTAALLLGAALGAAGVYQWIQRVRFAGLASAKPASLPQAAGPYAGSQSCRACHERFYDLWEPSHHGKAMQPVTAAFVADALTPLADAMAVGASTFSVDLAGRAMIEEGPDGTRVLPIEHALGGKNLYYFLTPREGGRLQVMPLAYDVRQQAWYHATSSMVRHFEEVEDEEVHWTDPLLTFNTSCYNCHVSQLTNNYDPETDTYHTVWREPGINCETCHGPGEEHIRVSRAVPRGTVPADLRLVSWNDLSVTQRNDACMPCHAKGAPITQAFAPGDRLFDHYDAASLEDPDFYPDGRDLGENYTQTAWLMNPCARSGLLDCLHCHTSSGRYRFQHENPLGSCLPCHAQRVSRIAEHSRHPPPPEGPQCIDCHMPQTTFARMVRSDHSMRPPVPEATLAFHSPNACTICHQDDRTEDRAQSVREWFPQNRWQDRILQEGALIEAARKRNWSRLPEMLAYLAREESDPVVAASLVRMLAECPDPSKWEPIRACLAHESPLVRARAAETLGGDLHTAESTRALGDALTDDSRLVRIRAASALAPYPESRLAEDARGAFQRAEEELLASFRARPDAWHSHYNLGNYRSDRGDMEAALDAYRAAMRLRRDVMQPYVNASVVASRLGRLEEGVRYLREAYAVDPTDGSVNLNLALALAEQGDPAAAKRHLQVAARTPHTRAQAAFNLAILAADRDPERAVALCRTAVKAAPENPRYAYALAFYLDQAGRPADAARELATALPHHPHDPELWLFLGECYLKTGQAAPARAHFLAMAANENLPPQARTIARRRLETLPVSPN